MIYATAPKPVVSTAEPVAVRRVRRALPSFFPVARPLPLFHDFRG